MSNAVKFTDKGNIKIVARLVDGKGDGTQQLEISIRDSGKGIPQSHLESIFEPFRQVECTDTRTHGGTGLGLTISQSLAQLMGGSIGIKSSISAGNHGSAFCLSLPYTPGAEQEASPEKPSPEALVSTKQQLRSVKGGKILLVEDNLVSRRMANRMLEKAGYEVTLAEDGVEAVEAFKSDLSFDLVLMGEYRHMLESYPVGFNLAHILVNTFPCIDSDVMMPRMDGLEAARTIRAIESSEPGHSKPVPIVALSAGAMKGDRESGLAVGMTDYLTKPVNYKLLLETLEKYIVDATERRQT